MLPSPNIFLPKTQLQADAGTCVCSGLGSGGDVPDTGVCLCQKDASSPRKVTGGHGGLQDGSQEG